MAKQIAIVSINKIENIDDSVIINLVQRACRRIIEDRVSLADLLTQGTLINWLSKAVDDEKKIMAVLGHIENEMKKPNVANFISTLYNAAGKKNRRLWVTSRNNIDDITFLLYHCDREPLNRDDVNAIVMAMMGEEVVEYQLIVNRVVDLAMLHGDIEVGLVEEAMNISEFTIDNAPHCETDYIHIKDHNGKERFFAVK